MKVLAITFACLVSVFAAADVGETLLFSVNDAGRAREDIPRIDAWRVVDLEPEYGGLWVVAGDLSGDGVPEIVSAENHNDGDVHFTSAVVAQTLEGEVLWRWGRPDIGRKTWHHDVACQIHDWDGNGQADVILCDEASLVELDGRTGAEKRRLPLPKHATDCLVFCDLAGKGRATDVLVKNRYEQIWAYDQSGALLWTVRHPGGFRTAHQPRPMDIDGDGRDEIMAGYAMLNADGSVRWLAQSSAVKKKKGHLDCARILETGDSPEEWRIVITCCSGNNLAVIDGNGALVWEVTGHHFESINVGVVTLESPGKQILVDIDHMPAGESPLWLLDSQGRKIGELITEYSRHHKLIDWTGNGLDEIVVAHSRTLYTGQGERLGMLAMPDADADGGEAYELSVQTGDMDGDGIADILLITPERVYIYKNPSNNKPSPPAPLGTGMNVTLY